MENRPAYSGQFLMLGHLTYLGKAHLFSILNNFSAMTSIEMILVQNISF